MNWTGLDTAYEVPPTKQNGLRFKMHTMIWGQQRAFVARLAHPGGAACRRSSGSRRLRRATPISR